MEDRLDAEATVEKRSLLWSITSVLMGLRYEEALIDHLLEGVMDMKESVIYQRILREGREEGLNEGRTEGELRVLLLVGEKRLGKPDRRTLNALKKITSPEQLEALASRLLEVESWSELLQ